MKRIVTGLKVVVKSLTSGRRIIPIGLVALKAVSKPNLLGSCVSQGRIVDLDVVREFWKKDVARRRVGFVICGYLLNADRGRKCIVRQPCEVNHLDLMSVRKPQTAVWGPRRGSIRHVGFGAIESVKHSSFHSIVVV